MAHRVPPGLPVLAAGRHRRPEHGACLMEYTSVLAGERFSDAPRCTDPALAALARAVNDATGDAERSALAVLAGDLAGANSAPPAASYAVVRRALLSALPLATGPRRHVLLVALLGLDRAAAGRRHGCPLAHRSPETELALLGREAEQQRAAAVVAGAGVDPRDFLRRGAPRAVELAVTTVAEESAEPGPALRGLLTAAVAEYVTAARAAAAAAAPRRAGAAA